MKRRLLSLLLAVCLVLPLLALASCAPGEQSGDSGQEELTRGEWIAQLGEAFGMDNYATEEPYFEDVPEDDPYYPYVQAAADWGVLSAYTGEEVLEPDTPITYEEAAVMAALAAGWELTEDQFLEDGTFDPSQAVAYAQEMGMMDPAADPEERVTRSQGETLTEAAKDVYLNAPVEERANVVFDPDLVDLTDAPMTWDVGPGGTLSPGGGTVETGEDGTPVVTIGTTELQEGSVVILPGTPEYPSGIAYKIEKIREEGGQIVFDTVTPTLEDLYDELDYQATVAADPADIIWAEGVTAGPAASGLSASESGNSYRIHLLSNGTENRAEPLGSLSVGGTASFSLGNGGVKVTADGQASANLGSGEGALALAESNFSYEETPSVEDFGGSTEPWSEPLEEEQKYSSGYEIYGNISLNDLSVTADVEFKKGWIFPRGIQTVSVIVNADISTTLGMEGTFSGEVPIGTVPVPLGPTGLTINIDLVLYADATGKLEVRASVSSQAGVEYNGNGLVKSPATSQAQATAEVAITLDFRARLCGTLTAFAVVDIVDVGVDVSGNLEASAVVNGTCDVEEADGITTLHYKESMDLNADLYVPMVSIYVGGSGTILGDLGISKTWQVLTKDKAMHFALLDHSWVFWEETVTMDEDGEILSTEEKSGDDAAGETEAPEETPGASDPDRLDLASYTLTLTDTGAQLELDLRDGESAPAVTWTSSDTSVALVSSDGYVVPVGEGTAVITAALQEDPSVRVSCAVFVQTTQENDWQFLPDVA